MIESSRNDENRTDKAMESRQFEERRSENMKIEHVAMYVNHLEEVKAFFVRFFAQLPTTAIIIRERDCGRTF